MQDKKLLILSILGATLLFAGALWLKTNSVSAAAYPSMIDKIAEKFNLNEDEVADVFNEMRLERQQERQKQMESGLDEAVQDGVITAEQKELLLNKHAEMQTEREEHRKEMQSWFENQGIDPQSLAPYRKFGRLGFKHGFKAK